MQTAKSMWKAWARQKKKSNEIDIPAYNTRHTSPKVIIIRKKLSQKFAYTLLRQTLALH